MKLNGVEWNWNQWIAFCHSLRVKASLTNLLDVRHNYWSFLMKFSNYCSDMVMDVVNTGSQNKSCWHWWAECHVERQALPSKWETRLTRMQFNANTCIFISIKDFQTHPPHRYSLKLSAAACHTIWTRYPQCDSTSSCKRIKWMRMSQTSQAATGTCKSKSKCDGKLPLCLMLMLPLSFYGTSRTPSLIHPAHSITFPTPAGGTVG